MDQNDVQSLKNLQKLDDVYLRDVVLACTGFKVLPVSADAQSIVNKLGKWIDDNFDDVKERCAEYTGRANELGNEVDKILREMIKIDGIQIDHPKLEDGTKQSVGYPDWLVESNPIPIFDENTKIYLYAEIKTRGTQTEGSTQRTFFYNPMGKNKIQHDAPHILVSFTHVGHGANHTHPFELLDFAIHDLYELKVKIKTEFNCGNNEIVKTNILFKRN